MYIYTYNIYNIIYIRIYSPMMSNANVLPACRHVCNCWKNVFHFVRIAVWPCDGLVPSLFGKTYGKKTTCKTYVPENPRCIWAAFHLQSPQTLVIRWWIGMRWHFTCRSVFNTATIIREKILNEVHAKAKWEAASAWKKTSTAGLDSLHFGNIA